MNVKVRSVGAIRQILDAPEVIVELSEGTTVGGLLSWLADNKSDKFIPYAAQPRDVGAYAPLRIIVNGRDVAPSTARDLVLNEGDDVLMFLPIAGG